MDIVEQIKSAVLPHVLNNPSRQEYESNLITHFIVCD